MADTPDDDPGAALPKDLRFLKTLVTVLTATMILGVLTVTVLLVIRLNAQPSPVLIHPELFALPPNVNTVGYSIVDGTVVLVGDDGVIRVFDAQSHDLLQSVPARPAQ